MAVPVSLKNVISKFFEFLSKIFNKLSKVFVIYFTIKIIKFVFFWQGNYETSSIIKKPLYFKYE